MIDENIIDEEDMNLNTLQTEEQKMGKLKVDRWLYCHMILDELGSRPRIFSWPRLDWVMSSAQGWVDIGRVVAIYDLEWSEDTPHIIIHPAEETGNV